MPRKKEGDIRSGMRVLRTGTIGRRNACEAADYG
jgi:hypothetical protein